jgi:hypothetical protein
MKFMLTFEWREGTKNQEEGIARFVKGKGIPPKGAKLLGRWTRADFYGGFDLLETDDPRTLTEFALSWSDLLHLQIFPVLDDESLTEVLKKTGRL